ncbi:ABC transporter permease subunit [Rossellomorea marisflavi]|uniref:ABC transporter permease n=1 Tax=Rossellomorea marisflavi TaxID=189381 RepID=UPI00345884E8
MKHSVWKNPLFLIGLLYITVLIMASFAYTWIWDDEIRRLYFISDNGEILEAAPISPKWTFPFGTDALGLDMLGKILIGAKFTVIAAIIIAFLRVVIALPLGFVTAVYLKPYKRFINGVVDSFHYLPLIILAYLFLYPILWMPFEGFSTTLLERMLFEVLILTFLIVPILSSLLSNEIDKVYKEDFILSAISLGAGKTRIMIKHIFPSIKSRLVLLIGQQIQQALILFIHLGLLTLFFGGTDVSYSPMPDPPQSITQEWSGLIGDSIAYLHTAPWVPLVPILFFASVILAVALMMEGYVRATSGYSYYKQRFKQRYTPAIIKTATTSKRDFKRMDV